MINIQLPNSDFFIGRPDHVVYDGDVNNIVGYFDSYVSHKSFTLRVVISGDEENALSVTLTASTMAVIDITPYLRQHASPASVVSVYVSMRATGGAGYVSAFDDTEFELVYMNGKSYQERTHYAERAVYIPDAVGGVEMMVSHSATILTDDGEVMTTEADTLQWVPAECATAIDVDFGGSSCIDDQCVWHYGVEGVICQAHYEGQTALHRVSFEPADRLNRWRLVMIDTQAVSGVYVDAVQFYECTLTGASFTLTLYDEQTHTATGDRLVVDISDATPLRVKFDTATSAGAFGSDTDTGEILRYIIYNSTQVGVSKGQMTSFISPTTLPNGVRGVASRPWSPTWQPPTCRRALPDQVSTGGVSWLECYTTDGDNLYITFLEAAWNDAISFPSPRLCGRMTAAGWQYDGAVVGNSDYILRIFNEWADGQTLEVPIYYTDREDTITLDTDTLVWHFVEPSCYGSFTAPDGTTLQLTTYTPATGIATTDDGKMIQVYKGGDTIEQLREQMSEEAGIAEYYTQGGDGPYFWTNNSPCCDHFTITKGDAWSSEEVDHYTIEVRRACWRTGRGMWLQYFNADGLVRYLPVEVKELTQSRERNDYRAWDVDRVRHLPGAVTASAERELEVVAVGIDGAIYMEDLPMSPELWLWPQDFSTPLRVVITNDEITRHGEDEERDYNLTLRTLA